jgi:ABC-type polysaccharide/polyol phosphate export permease
MKTAWRFAAWVWQLLQPLLLTLTMSLLLKMKMKDHHHLMDDAIGVVILEQGLNLVVLVK